MLSYQCSGSAAAREIGRQRPHCTPSLLVSSQLPSNNNRRRRWMWMVAAYGADSTAQVGGLGLSVGRQLALSMHSSNELVEFL